MVLNRNLFMKPAPISLTTLIFVSYFSVLLHTMLCCLTRSLLFPQALVIPEKFQHILRVLNTNIDGKQKIMFALTSIKVSGQAI